MSRFWTPKPLLCGERAFMTKKQQGSSAIAMLCVLLLSSCGPSPTGYSGGPTAGPTDTLSPLAPPNSNVRPPAPGTTGAPKTADGLPALQAKGSNTTLFSEKMSGEVDRLDRLENAVQELRNDFDAMAPAIVRLVAIEKDINDLIGQLEVLTGNAPAPSSDIPPINESDLGEAGVYPNNVEPLPLPAPPVAQETPAVPAVSAEPAPETPTPPPAAQPAPTPAPAPAAPAPAPAQATAPPAQIKPAASGTAVLAMRVGEHPGKTRIVLDVRGKTSFTTDLDKTEHILVVELPDAAWNAESAKSFAASPLISSYRVESMGDKGSMLVIQLKSNATVSYKGTIDNPDGGQRLVIDITPAP